MSAFTFPLNYTLWGLQKACSEPVSLSGRNPRSGDSCGFAVTELPPGRPRAVSLDPC